MKTTSTGNRKTEGTNPETVGTAKREYWNSKRRHSHFTHYRLVYS